MNQRSAHVFGSVERPPVIRVVLVEDHTLVRHATKALLSREPSLEVVGEADSAATALQLIAEVEPDVAVVDIRLKGSSGIDLAKAIKRDHPGTKVLVLTAYGFDQYLKAMVKAGAKGYLLKESSAAELLRAIREVHEGGTVLPTDLEARLADIPADHRPLDDPRPLGKLTMRELEVLELLQALSSREIAQRLGLSRKTVNTHVGHILCKLGQPSRAKAVARALEGRVLASLQ